MSEIVTKLTSDKLFELLTAGTNITLSVTGDTVTIATSGGGSGYTKINYTENEDETTNSTTAYVNKLNVVQSLPTTGTYLVEWSYMIKNNMAARGMDVAMTVNGIDYNVSNHVQSRSSAPIDYMIYSGFRERTINSGSNTFTLRFKCAAAGNISTIKNARILITKTH